MEPTAATPLEVDTLLERVLERPEAEWAAAIDDLCALHPQAATSLRRRFALLAETGLVGTVPRPEFLSPGQRFAGYQLLELLGAGGMGVVFRARKEGAADDVALKVLRPELLEHPTARSRFLREAASLADLVHPAVCALVDFGEHAGVPFLAMKLLRGRTLAAAVAEARRLARPGVVVGDEGDGPAWRAVVRLFATLAHGLAAVHARGLVHRDVKPDNIVVELGAPVLIDFGLAATADATRLTRSGEPLGTPAYMAPEQVRGGDVDARTDVYGLAAALYECVALRPPFLVAAREALYRAILTEDAPDVRVANPELPQSLALVLGKAMQKVPSARYASARAFAEELERVAEGKPVEARPVPIGRRVWRWTKAHPRAAISALAAALLLGMGGLVLQLAERSARIESEGLATSSAALLSRDATVGALVAREAWRNLPDSEATRSNLLRALSRNLQIGEFDVGRSVTGYLPSPDGGVALVLTNRVWLREGDRIRAVPGIEVEGAAWQFFNSAAWAPDGQSCLLAMHGDPNAIPPRAGILVRLARDGTRLPLADAVFPGSPNLSYGGGIPAVQVIAGLAEGVFVVGDVRGGLRAIDSRGATVAKWSSPSAPDQITFVGALADGRAFVTVDANGKVLRWDEPAGVPTVLFDTGRWVSAVCATAGCERLALGDVDGKVHVVAPTAGVRIASLDFGVAKPIEALALAADGTACFASAMGQRSALWELGSGTGPCEPRLVVRDRALQLVRAAAFSPDGTLIAMVGLAGRLEVIDRQGRALLDVAAARSSPLLVHFTGRRQVVTAGLETILREWRLDAPGFPVLRAHDYPALNLAWLPDGRSIVSSGADARLVWTDIDGTRLDAYAHPRVDVLLWAMALSPDGRQLVTGGNRPSALHRLQLDHASRRFAKIEPELGPRQWQSAAWFDNGSVLLGAVGGDILAHDFGSKTTTVWRRGDGAQAHGWGVWLDLGPDGSAVGASEDGSVSLWRAGGEFERILCTDDSSINAVDFAPDGASILIGLSRGRLFLVDRQGAVSRSFGGCLGKVAAARFSPDGAFVAAVCSDSQLLVWRTDGDGSPWVRLPLPSNMLAHALAFSPDSEQVAVACSDGAIHIWPVSERRIASVADTIFRDLRAEERRTILGR